MIRLAIDLEQHPDRTGPVWGLWHGGGNYGAPKIEDMETWASLQDAITEATNRMQSGHWFAHEFHFVNREPARALTPCVDEQSQVEIFLTRPTPDEYGITSTIPDLVLVFDEEQGDYVIEPLGDYVTTGRVR